MDCQQTETRILDLPELDRSLREQVEAHAVRCSICNELLGAAVALDVRVSVVAKAPENLRRRAGSVIPCDFKLLSRISKGLCIASR